MSPVTDPNLRVLVLTTGGTITMRPDPEGLAPGDTPAPCIVESVPDVRQLARCDCQALADVDSANLQPDLWTVVARTIYDHYADYDGFVVTHGTDTMVYTAAALSFFLQELGKPVVLTGAQVPLDQVGTDGRANFINAVRVAASDLGEVAIVFGRRVMRGTRARKTSAMDLEAFRSVNDVPIGSIGLTLRLDAHARPRANRRRPLFAPYLEPRVARLSVWPGLDPALLVHLAETHAGIVLEGFGVGTLPSRGAASLIPAIHAATVRGVPVVVSTQCVVGSTAMELYRVGRSALDAGAIPAMDMTPEAAQVKLMWVLGQTRDLRTVESMMLKDYAGELHTGL